MRTCDGELLWPFWFKVSQLLGLHTFLYHPPTLRRWQCTVGGVVALVHDPPADFPIVADCTGGSDKNGPPREPPCICTP